MKYKKQRLINFIFRVLTSWIFRKLYAYYIEHMNGGYKPMYIYPRDTAGFAPVSWGVWERWNIEAAILLIDKHFQLNPSAGKPFLALDVGANVGIYTVNLALKFDKLVAIEASPIVSKVLEANVLTNQLEHLVDVRAIAIGNDELIHTLHINLKSSGLSSFVTVTKGVTKETAIQMHRGDVILNENYNSYRLTFVKCDVEGYELNALKGLDGWLNRDHPLIQIEHDARLENSKVVLSYLKLIGYEFMYVREGGIPRIFRPILATAGLWPNLKQISRIENRFYQAIWLSKVDLLV